MPVMEKLRMFVAEEPIVAASCLIAGVVEDKRVRNLYLVAIPDMHTLPKMSGIGTFAGLFLPAVVRPILDSLETSKPVPPPALNDVVAGVTGKKQG